MPFDGTQHAELVALAQAAPVLKNSHQWERELELSAYQIAEAHRVVAHFKTAADRLGEEVGLRGSRRRELLLAMIDGCESFFPAGYLNALALEAEHSRVAS